MLDQTGYELSPENIAVNEALDRLLEFFGPNGERWCPDRGVDGRGRFCIALAPPVCADAGNLYLALNKVVKARGFQSVPHFNDHPDTHWTDVVALISEARR